MAMQIRHHGSFVRGVWESSPAAPSVSLFMTSASTITTLDRCSWHRGFFVVARLRLRSIVLPSSKIDTAMTVNTEMAE